MNNFNQNRNIPENHSSSFIIKDRLITGVFSNIVMQPIILLLGFIGSIVVARTLGPELLAIIASISAIATTVIAFSDLGIARSLPKIIQDISVQYGTNSAILIQNKLSKIKIFTTCLLLSGLLFLHFNKIPIYSVNINMNNWFLILVIVKSLLGALILVKKSVAFSAFKNKELVLLNLIITLLNPILIIIAALISRNPYIIFAVSLIEDILQLIIMKKFIYYDLDKEKKLKTNYLSHGLQEIIGNI